MDLLFNDHSITDAIRHFEGKLRKEVEAIDATRLLNTGCDHRSGHSLRTGVHYRCQNSLALQAVS